jgi:hypothetical protein
VEVGTSLSRRAPYRLRYSGKPRASYRPGGGAIPRSHPARAVGPDRDDVNGRAIRFGVILDGWELYAITRVLSRHLPEYLEPLPLHLREPIEDRFAECLQMAREWTEDRKRGSAEAAPAEVVTDSSQELTSTEVATILNVSERRVRQLAEAGALAGHQRKRGGPWIFDRGAVLAHAQRTGGTT